MNSNLSLNSFLTDIQIYHLSNNPSLSAKLRLLSLQFVPAQPPPPDCVGPPMPGLCVPVLAHMLPVN